MAAIPVMSMVLEEEEEFEEEEELITATAGAIRANLTARERRWWMHPLNEQRSLEGVCNLNDISILTLERPIDGTDNAEPVCLPTGSQCTNLFNRQCTVTGWGATDTANGHPVAGQTLLPPPTSPLRSALSAKPTPVTETRADHYCASMTGLGFSAASRPTDLLTVTGLLTGIYTDVSANTDWINSVTSS
ncbi:trypsin-like [Haliotis asinina]|uniref:trypsin-like n=1 Tax=Haliotis asinina TaxID=109174 RepID=UPI003531FADF